MPARAGAARPVRAAGIPAVVMTAMLFVKAIFVFLSRGLKCAAGRRPGGRPSFCRSGVRPFSVPVAGVGL
ncbi:hypothetical protein BJ981_007345 [Sphaerisporangium krabiense]|uniref:Uncharacterized protein n=1 Tax=Sphaerisporangium krabiense TaxID=763782 RepID=A0A7W8ZCK0_9ACTN|nr:hypothetical protein [Sphaerisporangium krabiense]